MMSFKLFHERKLTPAELKKREEIAKGIEKSNPGIAMDKKMAIATATVKKMNDVKEVWYKDLANKINQLRHPKGWAAIVKQYADMMKKDPKHPDNHISRLAQVYTGIEGRALKKYINDLVKKGKLPKELMAQVEEGHGAGEEGTDKLRKKYQKDTPGEEVINR